MPKGLTVYCCLEERDAWSGLLPVRRSRAFEATAPRYFTGSDDRAVRAGGRQAL